MRKLFLTLIFLPIIALASSKSFTVNAKGMTCGSCVDAVKKEIANLTGEIDGLIVNVSQNKAEIDYSKTKINPKKESELRMKIEAAIKKAGFKVAG